MKMNQEILKQLSDQKYALDQAAIVAATDSKGIITYVNDKFCEVTGYEREDLVGKTHKIINSGQHPKSFFADLWKTIGSGKVWRGEVCNRKKNGDLYWVYTTIVPFLDETAKPTQYLSIRYEITELKLAQQTILKQQEKLVASSRLSAIGEMAAAITHEINNPLGVILGRAEMLKSILSDSKQELDRDEISHIVDTIEITGQRIAKIVRSMKTMAHHQEEEAPQKCSVKTILDDALDLCLFRLQKHGVELRRADMEENVYLFCRSHQVVQVLVNLINNSFDAISNISDRWLQIEVVDNKDFVEIAVTDSGKGIPAEVQKKMFNPFFSTKPVQYGTGLGLSISQGLLQKNNASLEYDDKCVNTRFVLRFQKEAQA